MSHAADLPLLVAIPVALLLLIGAGLALTGSIGLLRLSTFYERLHAPTIGTSCGMGCILLASMLFFSVLQSRLALHEVLIGILLIVTTPVTLMLVGRAALHRDRLEGSRQVPASARPEGHSASQVQTGSEAESTEGAETGIPARKHAGTAP
ncbi:monovalent cation/H(+) antiporter subunit G [Pseudoroseomonas ludipueritiae]|uniref:Cation:proton antiporter n=1 Tax=Pseudoroseomonas ludipueritiae TaxID=198093 RepID=A0ABR7R2T8_9PROT|nr:monovalent cation/H(+) antiporter subunit G [Pseudoroseomonas ludipueritiae]MBC9176035.1 cation:proton antiporter [Pseudoroseomonas ludipueritiae]